MKTKLFSMGLAILFVGMLVLSTIQTADSRSIQPIVLVDLPISINDNIELALESSSGTGTAIDPYIIANRVINGSVVNNCIYIGNTTAHVTIRNCTLNWSAGNGIYIVNATNVDVEECNISWNLIGIYIAGFSYHNHIDDTNINNCTNGIAIVNSNYTTIDSNDIKANVYGIRFITSNNNTINDNNCSESLTPGNAGIYAWPSCTYSNFTGNRFWNNEAGLVVGVGSDWNNIYNNVAIGSTILGFSFAGAENCTISYNNVSNSGSDGLGFSLSASNIIHHNSICDNIGTGIWVTSSTYCNHFYANNFIGNGQQAWDDSPIDDWNWTYGVGGNYWSNWTGIDTFSGVLQDIPGADGIVDTPYPLDKSTPDNDKFPKIEKVNLTLPFADLTSPTINQTTPTDGEIDVSISVGGYSIQFSEPMNNSVGTFTTNLPNLTFDWSNDTIWVNGTFGELDYNTTYYANLTNFEDLAGNPLSITNLTFTTEMDSVVPQTNETITDIIINLIPVFITIVMVMFILRFISTIITGKKKE